MHKIIITGGNGFIEKELLRLLTKKYLIHVLDSNIKKYNSIRYLKSDITDLKSLKKIIRKLNLITLYI